MKKIWTLLFLAFSIGSFGQTYPSPDYNNTPFLYNGKELIELDAVQYVIGARPKGLTGAEAALYLNGTTSSVKVEKENAQFIVKLEVGVDPRTLMDLNKTTVNDKSGKREFVVYKKGMFTAEGTNPTIDISFKKISDGVYLVTSKAPLTSGEYFFSVMANAKSKIVYCFSVK
ncbi:hypothetical protein [Flavobacterium filum]|uniref:hypothetical protein n=1 Tax=Flavobacterium filum TaxID=370974 RepID=UPI0023F3F757|nr:hypothetical protein [Flavobacterium filum]